MVVVVDVVALAVTVASVMVKVSRKCAETGKAAAN